MPKPSAGQIITFERLLTNQLQSTSPVVSPTDIQLKIPEYQRELAWDYERKMIKLWADMFRHAQITSNLTNDPFFLGNITVNHYTSAVSWELVDGQQRITTLHVIASAIRDAFISTGYQSDAYKIQSKLLTKDTGEIPRILPLENPNSLANKPSLSSRKKLAPYHKLISQANTGIVVNQDQILSSTWTTINIDASKQYQWEAKRGDRKVMIRRNDRFLPDLIEWQMVGHMVHQANTGNTIQLKYNGSGTSVELKNLDQIWLAPDAKWWHEFEDVEADTYDQSKNTMFASNFRRLYCRVRGDVEHYILGEKKFTNPRNWNISPPPTPPAKPKYSRRMFDNLHPLVSSCVHFIGNTVPLSSGLGNLYIGDYNPNTSIPDPIDMTQSDGRNGHWEALWRDITFPSCRPDSALTVPSGAEITIPFYSGLTSTHTTQDQKKDAMLGLIQNVTFVGVTYTGSPANAIGYFLDVNDPAKHSPLQTFDLVNGMVQKIIHSSTTSANLTRLENAWAEIRKCIYEQLDKNPEASADFFYNFLIADKRWKSKGGRYEKGNTFVGLMDSWPQSELFDTSGTYNLTYLADEFEKLQAYAEIFATIWAPQLLSAPIAAINPTPDERSRRKRKQYLFVLKNFSEKQWIAPYMALQYHLQNKSIVNTEQHLETALYDYILMIIKYGGLWKKILPEIKRDTPGYCEKCVKSGTPPTPTGPKHQGSLYKSNDYYGLVVGTGKYIDQIHTTLGRKSVGSTLSNPEINKLVKYLRTATIFNGGLPPGTREFYVSGDSHLEHIQRNLSKGLFFAYEAAISGFNDPIGWEDLEIEHILPESPTNWGPYWYAVGRSGKKQKTLAFNSHIQLMGNKLLIETSINRHVSNHTLEQKRESCKCPKGKTNCATHGCQFGPTTHTTCDSQHYKESKMKGVQLHTSSYPSTWTDTNIKNRTRDVITTIIDAYDDW